MNKIKENGKRILLSIGLIFASLLFIVGCGTSGDTGNNDTGSTDDGASEVVAGGTIMWLSNLSSGMQYEAAVNYATAVAEELGYKLTVVYGDLFNDPAGNLNAVRNGMTSDVVGLITSQDGGIGSIMEEFPELYVAGYNTDMRTVFGEDGPDASLLENTNFLGTIADGFSDGANLGEQYAEQVINAGHSKVSVVQFPEYAYPNLGEAAVRFREVIEEHNQSASDEETIEIIGDTRVLEFEPLPDAYFQETGMSEVDAIVGFLAGVDFVFPTMSSAINSGTISEDTKLITGGFTDSPEILEQIGEDGIIQFVSISPTENIAYSIALLDNALTNMMYVDFTKSEQVDSLPYELDSKADVENVMNKSLTGTGDPANSQITQEDLHDVLRRFNEDATYQELKDLFQSDQLTVDALETR